MEKLTEKFAELYDETVAQAVELKAGRVNLAVKEAKYKVRAAKLKVEGERLEREGRKIKHVKDLVQLGKDSNAASLKAKKDMANVEKEKEDFEAWKAKETKKLNAVAKETTEINEEIKETRKRVQEVLVDVEARKKIVADIDTLWPQATKK